MLKEQMQNYNRTYLLGHDENSVEVFTRISPRAKKISIKITGHRGVELIIPKRVTEKQAMAFLYSKEDWVIEKSKEINIRTKAPFVEGARIPIQGELYTIEHSGMIRGTTRLHGDRLIVCGEKSAIPRKVTMFLQELAKKEIAARAQVESMKLGVKYNRITVRDTETRWGSCSQKKNLSFSWRLILAPREVLEYVVAHEIAHLKEMNHSKEFWTLVESIFPAHKATRNWLKEHGSTLHTYG